MALLRHRLPHIWIRTLSILAKRGSKPARRFSAGITVANKMESRQGRQNFATTNASGGPCAPRAVIPASVGRPRSECTAHLFACRNTARLALGLCALLLGLSILPPALHAATPEYRIKAVFLFHFAQFVEWPPAAFADAQSPLVIGVLGDDPFDTALDETVRDETVNSRPLVVRRFRRAEEIGDCHILYISRSEEPRFPEIFARLRGRSILTVGDAEGFAVAGGMIRFLTAHNKTRLRINVEAARAVQLTLSSKLLRPAEIVTSPSPGLP